jgi:hypothetical protein
MDTDQNTDQINQIAEAIKLIAHGPVGLRAISRALAARPGDSVAAGLHDIAGALLVVAGTIQRLRTVKSKKQRQSKKKDKS